MTETALRRVLIDLSAGGGLGAPLGTLVGLSVSEVVGTVVGGLLALLAGFFGLTGKSESSATPSRITGFSVAGILALFFAVYVRTHNMLGPTPEATRDMWVRAGFDRQTAQQVAAIQVLGLPRDLQSMATGTGPKHLAAVSQSVLFATESSGHCADLERDRSINAGERLNQFELAGGKWAVVAAALKAPSSRQPGYGSGGSMANTLHQVARKFGLLFRFLFACIMSLALVTPTFSEISTATLNSVSSSIVQIRCGEHRASGFVLKINGQVITALHAVANCSPLSVYFPRHGVGRRADTVRVLNEADLALLRVEGAPVAEGLSLEPNEPELHEELTSLGFPLNSPTIEETRLAVAYGSNELKDILNDQLRQEITEAGAPSLKLSIIRLDGHLMPGSSGAPFSM